MGVLQQQRTLLQQKPCFVNRVAGIPQLLFKTVIDVAVPRVVFVPGGEGFFIGDILGRLKDYKIVVKLMEIYGCGFRRYSTPEAKGALQLIATPPLT